MPWTFNPFTGTLDFTSPETDPIAMAYLNQSVKTTASPTFQNVTIVSGGKVYLDG